MAHAFAPSIAHVRQTALDPIELVRFAIVIACALALIAAGQVLPI